jgi:hypothetical protein
MNANDKNIGIGLSVLGGAGLLWVFTRVTSLEGQLHSWSPPFESYEVTTIIVGLVAFALPRRRHLQDDRQASGRCADRRTAISDCTKWRA